MRSLATDRETLARKVRELEANRNAPVREAVCLALAEAYVRLARLEADRRLSLLELATQRDPYHARAWLQLACARREARDLPAAIDAVDTAGVLSGDDVDVRSVRARLLLDATRQARSVPLAEAALDDLEALVEVRASTTVALDALEAAVHGKPKRLRSALEKLAPRLEPEAKHRGRFARLVYQAIFALPVGKPSKGRGPTYDEQNVGALRALRAVIARWRAAFPEDAYLGGADAAAEAKGLTPEELCDRIEGIARLIPEVRAVRLLLRERLAAVPIPEKRLELFERAMSHIPSLDGIAHDYLQLVHLVAMRAVALGDVETAARRWDQVLTRDPFNLGAVSNLYRLATHRGDTARAAKLLAVRTQLRQVYARFGQRPDLVLHAAASERLVLLEDRLSEKQGDGAAELTAKTAMALCAAWVRGAALWRAALDPHPEWAELVKDLLDETVDDEGLMGRGRTILETAVSGELPIAYQYLDCSKDATEATLRDALAKARESWAGLKEELTSQDEDAAVPPDRPRLVALEAFVLQAEAAIAPLFDAKSRAEYDQRTLPVEWAEMIRTSFLLLRRLLDRCQNIEGDVLARVDLANRLSTLLYGLPHPYLVTLPEGPRAIEERLPGVAYGCDIDSARKALHGDDPAGAARILRPLAELKVPSFGLHFLLALAELGHPERSPEGSWDATRANAKIAMELDGDVPAATFLAASQLADLGREQFAIRRANRTPDAVSLDTLKWFFFEKAWPYPSVDAPPGAGFDRVPPSGSPALALSVAREVRADCVSWLNRRSHDSPKAALRAFQECLKAGRAADRWAQHARQHAAAEGDAQTEELAASLLDTLAQDREKLLRMTREMR